MKNRISIQCTPLSEIPSILGHFPQTANWSQYPELFGPGRTQSGVILSQSLKRAVFDMARPRKLTARALAGLNDAEKIIRFIETLRLAEGPLAGQQIRLAEFQKRFLRGAYAPENHVGVLSIGRGNGKSAIAAGAGLATLIGICDTQPRREILVASRNRDQSRAVWNFAESFCHSLPEEYQKRLTFRRAPRLEFEDDNGPHVFRAVPADGRSLLGGAPVLAIFDERGHWEADRGDAVEQSILTGLGKKAGRALMISTSANNDAHAFSRWIDSPPPGCYVQEHRPPPGLPADDLESLLLANPGAEHGIGASVEWLQAAAERAIARGGSALTAFRLYYLNQRCSSENRDVLLTLDQWLDCETDNLPPRKGPCIIGVCRRRPIFGLKRGV